MGVSLDALLATLGSDDDLLDPVGLRLPGLGLRLLTDGWRRDDTQPAEDEDC